MRRLALVVSLLALGSRAYGYGYWNEIRHSALLPDSAVVIRVENPSGIGVENRLLYAGAGIVEQAMIPIADGPSTVSATVPGPVSAPRYYGFRLIQGGELDLMPVRVADGSNPTPPDLTPFAADPAGDQLYGYVNLDLVECRVSFSGTKLFAALKNAGGGFPVNSGLTFFGYLIAIANPALADSDTVFAVMQTINQPGVIVPGLYKITGPGLGDLVKIGNVSVQEFPAASTLLLSCDLADLLADPYFLSWYDPADPAIGLAGFTQRITLLGGAAEADRTAGGHCYLREFSISPAMNALPTLAGLSFEGSGAGAYANVNYSDPDGNFPIVAEIAFDGGASYTLYPQSLDYGSAVQYRSATGIAPLANDSWSRAVARFSDNLSDTLEVEAVATAVADDMGQAVSPPFRATIAPNPFSASASIEIDMRAHGYVRVEIFDARGALVRTIMSGPADSGTRRFVWDGRDGRGVPCSSGLYFCRISSAREAIMQKALLVR